MGIDSIIVQAWIKAKSDKQARNKFTKELKKIHFIKTMKKISFYLDDIGIESDDGESREMRAVFCPNK